MVKHMLTFLLDPSSQIPLYEQLYRFIREEIKRGRLKPHEKMPSKRKLAAHLKISVVTVEGAYAQLTAEGYLTSLPRRGYFVQQLEHKLPPQVQPAPKRSETAEERYEFDFRTNVVDTDLFPFSTWAKLAREVLSESGGELLNVTHPQGALALRREIATYLLSYRGISADPEQIVVGAGTEYLMGLILQLLGRGNTYAVENPGYGRIVSLLRRNEVRAVPVPLDEEGLRVDRLRETGADIVHVTPSHQFPLGVVMPVRRRLELLHWAGEEAGRYILEDDYDSEFRFSGQPIPALQGLDTFGRVIYLNAFTKSLAPSLRISYMVLPLQLLDTYREKFHFYACTVSNFEQYTLSRFLSRGHFERHLGRMKSAYRERRDSFLRALSSSRLSGFTEAIGYEAGLHLLLRVRNGMKESELVARAKEAGVRVYGLSEYDSFPPGVFPESTVVIGYSDFPTAKIEAAVARLEQAWIIHVPGKS